MYLDQVVLISQCLGHVNCRISGYHPLVPFDPAVVEMLKEQYGDED